MWGNRYYFQIPHFSLGKKCLWCKGVVYPTELSVMSNLSVDHTGKPYALVELKILLWGHRVIREGGQYETILKAKRAIKTHLSLNCWFSVHDLMESNITGLFSCFTHILVILYLNLVFIHFNNHEIFCYIIHLLRNEITWNDDELSNTVDMKNL